MNIDILSFILITSITIIICCVYIEESFSPTANVDYNTNLVPSLLTFPSGAVAGNSQCFDVTTLLDGLVEGVEDFLISLVSASSLVTVDPATSQATVNIIDVDGRLCWYCKF